MRCEIQESSKYRGKKGNENGKENQVKAKTNHLLKGKTENKNNCVKKKTSPSLKNKSRLSWRETKSNCLKSGELSRTKEHY